MAEKINVNFRADPAKIAALDAMAKAQDRDRSYLINDAVEVYLAQKQWLHDQIKKSIAQADAGEFLSEEEVKEMYSRWGITE